MKTLIFKNCLTILLLTLSIQNFCYSQEAKTIVIQPKVGTMIDSIEKEKYKLFPEYSDETFNGAIIREFNDRTLEQWVYLKDGSTEKQKITRDEFLEMKKSIRGQGSNESGSSTIVFSVKPGINLNGANIGIKKGKFEPYFGMQFINFNEEYDYKSESTYDEDYVRKTNLHIYMPFIGSKFFLLDKESLKTSLNVTLFKPIIFGKQTYDGEEDEQFKENLKNIKIVGGEIGFGSEYFLSEYFSLGGEFGVRLAYFKDEYESSDSYYSYTDIMKLNMTYVSASFNFYFAK